MSIKKNHNKIFIVKIIFLVLAMIGAIAGLIVCAILLASKGFSWECLGGLALAIIILYWSIRQVSNLNRVWSRKIIAAIKNDEMETITKWTHDEIIWKSYINWRKDYDWQEVKGMTMWTMIIGMVIFCFVLYSEFEWLMLAIVTIGSGLLFGALIGALFYSGYRMRLQKISSSSTGSIIFTKDHILVNNLLIHFNQMGSSLGSVKIVKNDNWDLLQVVIETQANNRKNEHTYLIPIPHDKIEEATKLVNLYLISQ